MNIARIDTRSEAARILDGYEVEATCRHLQRLVDAYNANQNNPNPMIVREILFFQTKIINSSRNLTGEEMVGAVPQRWTDKPVRDWSSHLIRQADRIINQELHRPRSALDRYV